MRLCRKNGLPPFDDAMLEVMLQRRFLRPSCVGVTGQVEGTIEVGRRGCRACLWVSQVVDQWISSIPCPLMGGTVLACGEPRTGLPALFGPVLDEMKQRIHAVLLHIGIGTQVVVSVEQSTGMDGLHVLAKW